MPAPMWWGDTSRRDQRPVHPNGVQTRLRAGAIAAHLGARRYNQLCLSLDLGARSMLFDAARLTQDSDHAAVRARG